MATMMKGVGVVICVFFLNLVGTASAEYSNALSRLYKKGGSHNRPVVLVLDNNGLTTGDRHADRYRHTDRDRYTYLDTQTDRDRNTDVTYREKDTSYGLLQKLLEGHSHEVHTKTDRRPRNHNRYQRPRPYTNKYNYKNDRDTYKNNDDRTYRDERDREDRQTGNRGRYRYRARDRMNRYNQDTDRRDRYRTRVREDNRYNRDKTRLRTRDQEQDRQVQDQDRRDQDQDRRDQDQDRRDQDRKDQQQDRRDQDRRDQDQDRRDQDQDRRDQDQDKRDQDQDRKDHQRSEGTARAQIPIVKSLLRSLNCNARDECEDTCDDYDGNDKDDCADECEQKYECEDEEEEEDECSEKKKPECSGSTKGVTLVTEKPGCKRC